MAFYAIIAYICAQISQFTPNYLVFGRFYAQLGLIHLFYAEKAENAHFAHFMRLLAIIGQKALKKPHLGAF